MTAADRGAASVAFAHPPSWTDGFGYLSGVLRNEHDAEDAFQTTFLVLATRSYSLRSANALGPWLHQSRLGHRNGLALRKRRPHLRGDQSRAAAHGKTGSGTRFEREELIHLIHQEVARLPERYRAVIVLCDLQSES